MAKNRGIPREMVEKLSVEKKEKPKEYEVPIIVEKHQVKIPIPKKISVKMKLEKGARGRVYFDKEKMEIVCKLI